jgi:hypothetical protein
MKNKSRGFTIGQVVSSHGKKEKEERRIRREKGIDSL